MVYMIYLIEPNKEAGKQKFNQTTIKITKNCIKPKLFSNHNNKNRLNAMTNNHIIKKKKTEMEI